MSVYVKGDWAVVVNDAKAAMNDHRVERKRDRAILLQVLVMCVEQGTSAQ